MKNLIYILPLILIFSCRKSHDLVPVENSIEKISEHDLVPPGGFNLVKRKIDLLSKKSWTKPVQKDTVTGEYQYVIFLDFDGHDASNTLWSFDSALVVENSGLNEQEQAAVVTRARQFFRYQTIYVTADVDVYNKAAADKRQQIVITQTSFAGMVGGTAYLNSLFWGNNTPAYVFSMLLNYSVENIARAAVHEAGHTLGLRHQADGYFDESKAWVKTAEYRRGTRGRAILMGYLYGGKEAEWGYGRDPFGNLQKDTEHIEKVTGGRYTPQGNLNPLGE